jgi:hypothetical protein
MESVSSDWTMQQYLDVLGISLISTDCIKSFSEIVYETYTKERQILINEPKYKNYLKEIKKMLKNINERLKVYGGGIEFNDLSGVVRVLQIGNPMREDTYSDIFYYKLYKYVQETLDGTWDDLDIKEILVGAFNDFISRPGKLKGENNIDELTDAFRVCIDNAAERSNLYRHYGWFTAEDDVESHGSSKRKKSKSKKSKSKKSKSKKSKSKKSKSKKSKSKKSKSKKSKIKKSKS